MASNPNEDLGLVLDVARILHSNGERTAVTKALAVGLAEDLGLGVRVDLTWAATVVHQLVDDVPTDTKSASASPVAVNMARVTAVHRAVQAVRTGQLDRASLDAALRSAAGLPTTSTWLFVVACTTGAGALSMIFGAHHSRTIACIALAAALGGLLRRKLAARGVRQPGQVLTAALLAGLTGALAVRVGVGSDLGLVALAPCMILVPGPHILNGCFDLLAQRVQLGAARLTLAVTIVAAITAGVIVGLTAGGSSLPSSATTPPDVLVVDVAAAGVAALSYALYLSAPLSIVAWPIAAGAAAHGLRWLAIHHLGATPALGAGVTCLFVGEARDSTARPEERDVPDGCAYASRPSRTVEMVSERVVNRNS